MLIGYSRVSTVEQDDALQLAALAGAKVDRVFRETRAGAGVVRPELERMLDVLRAGDVVIVYKLDRLGRSLRDLIAILDRIEHAGASFRSLSEPVDTSTPAGRMLMHMLGAVAEFERGLVRERTAAGLAAARERGAHIGRRAALSSQEARRAADLLSGGKTTVGALARLYGCHRSSIKRAIHRARLDRIVAAQQTTGGAA